MFGQGFGGGSAFGQQKPGGFGTPAAGGSAAFGAQPSSFGTPAAGASPFGAGGGAFQQQPAAGGGFGGGSPAFGQPAAGGAFGAGAAAPAAGAFGAPKPAFGQPAAGGFGAQQQASPFGAAAASTPAFGAAPGAQAASPFGGAAASTSPGAFGAPATSGAFGQQQGGYGATPGASTPFGGAAGGAFGQQAAASPFGGGGAAAGGAFGAGAGQTGSRTQPYQVTAEQDTTAGHRLNFQSISAMAMYKGKSAEELRWEDYQRNDKGGAAPAGSPGAFGAAPAGSPGAFGAASTPAYGAPNAAASPFGVGGAFGAPAQSTPAFGQPQQAGAFGATPAFGQSQPAGAFGAATPASGGGLFGAQTQPTTPGFGATPAAATPAFGATATTPFGGTPAATPAFGAAAASSPAFGAPAASTPAFGGFGAASTPAFAPASTPAFGAAPASSPAFGAAAPAAAGGLFGATQQATPSFGAPAAATPAFGAAAPAPAAAGGGLFGAAAPASATPAGGLFGAPAAATPAAGGLFGATAASTPGFGAAASAPGSLFGGARPQAAAPAFGAAAIPSLFGGAAPAAGTTPGTGLFGAPPAATPPLGTTPTLFGVPGAATPGAATPGALAVVPGAASPYPPTPAVPTLGATAAAPAGVAPTPGTVSSLVPGGYMGQSPAVVFAPRRVTPLSQMKVRVRKQTALSPAAAAAQAAAGALSEADGGMWSASPLGPAYALPAARDNPRALFIRKTDKQQQLEASPLPAPAMGTLALPAPGGEGDAAGAAGTPTTISVVRAGRRVRDEEPAAPALAEDNTRENGTNGVHADAGPPRLPRLGCDGKHEDYEMEPSAEQLADMARESADALKNVEGFTVSRRKFGSVRWIGETNVSGLDLDAIVRFYPAGVEVYKDENGAALKDKPPRGSGLNRPAVVTLHNVRPKSGPMTSGAKLAKWVERLKEQCVKMGATFRGYDAESEGGTWSFRVEHFSTYGLDDDFFMMDEDEEEDDDEARMAEEQDAVLVSKPGDRPPAEEVALAAPDMDIESEEELPAEEPPQPAQRLPTASAGALPVEIGRAHHLDAERAYELREALFSPPPAAGVHARTPTSMSPPPKRSRAEPSPVTAALTSAAAAAASAPARRARAPFSAPNASAAHAAGGAVDAALLLGKSTRAGWGPGLMLVHACPRSAAEVASQGRAAQLEGAEAPAVPPCERVNSQIRVERVVIDPAIEGRSGGARMSLLATGASAPRNSSEILASRYTVMLEVAQRYAVAAEPDTDEEGDGAPCWQQRCTPRLLAQLCEEHMHAAEDEATVSVDAAGSDVRARQARADEARAHVEAWHLISTLFAALPGGANAGADEEQPTRAVPMSSLSSWAPFEAARRRALLSGWLARHTRAAAVASTDAGEDDGSAAAAAAGLEALLAAGGACSGEAAPTLAAALARATPALAQAAALLEAVDSDPDAIRKAAAAAARELGGDDADPDKAAATLLQACRSVAAKGAAEAAPGLRSVLHLLSGHLVSEAAEAAAALGETRLASLIASAGCGRATRSWLQAQVRRWEEAGFFDAPARFHPERVRLYRLLAGDIQKATSGAVMHDWKRALGARLWYGAGACATGAASAAADALVEYGEALREGCESAPPPLPAYAERRTRAGRPPACEHEDLTYHLLQLGCAGTSYEAGTAGDPTSGNALGRMLCPEGHVANALDHRLSWAAFGALTACGALPVTVARTAAAAAVHAAFASQLECLGLPQWAAFVALHAPPALGHIRGGAACPRAREAAVREMLGRTAPVWANDAAMEAQLASVGGVPRAWIDAARAQFEAYRGGLGGMAVASSALLVAGASGEAHALLMRRVAAPLLLGGAEGVARLEELLARLLESRDSIARWADGGNALLDALDAARQRGDSDAAITACEQLAVAAGIWRDTPAPFAAPSPAALSAAPPRPTAAATGVAALAALAEKVVGALYAREGNTSRAHFAALAAPLAPERRETHLLSAASAFLEMRA